MKCFRYFSFALFALLGVFFGSFIINQNDTYAVDDITYTMDSNNLSPYDMCGGSSSISCDGYKYIYISSFSDNLCPVANSINVYVSTVTYRIYPCFNLLATVDLSSIVRLNPGSFITSSNNSFVTFVLSENNPYVSGITPSGSIELTENGTYDVTNYAEAVVNVPETDCPPSSGGDYHNDLVAINNSIMICAATCLVIYFFYCIYRMIIKNSGVK